MGTPKINWSQSLNFLKQKQMWIPSLKIYFTLLQVIVKTGPGTFLSLAVYDNYIFWSDWGRRAILRSSKYTGGDTKILRSDIPHQPMGIIAVANDTNSCKSQ